MDVRSWQSFIAMNREPPPADEFDDTMHRRRGAGNVTTTAAASSSSVSSVAGLHGGNYYDLTGSVDDDVVVDSSPRFGGDVYCRGAAMDDGRAYVGEGGESSARNAYKRPKPWRRGVVDVIDLVGCSSSEDHDDEEDDDEEEDDGMRKKRSLQRLPPPPPTMRRKRSRRPLAPNNDDLVPRLVEHMNLPPRRTLDGATVTFGLLGLVDVLRDGSTLTCEGNPASSMTKLLEPVHRPPSQCASSDHSSSSPLPFNRQPLHYQQDDNFSCGYRNLQMLISGMMPTLGAVFPGGVPCVGEIQRTMEELWGKGFDRRNAEHHRHSLVGKRTWIGTVEVWSYLSYKRVDSIIVQFIKTSENRALLGKFVWAYFGRMCGCSCRGEGHCGDDDDNDDCAMGGRYRSKATSPLCLEYADNLIRLITKPNFDSLLAAAGDGGGGTRTGRRRCECSLPPLYLQWEGHSVTVVGIRKIDNADGRPPSFALVVFCPQKNVADVNGALAREFTSRIADGFDFADSESPSSLGNRAIQSVMELPANRLLQKDCQILLSVPRVIDEGESYRRKFCSNKLGFINAVSIDDSTL